MDAYTEHTTCLFTVDGVAAPQQSFVNKLCICDRLMICNAIYCTQAALVFSGLIGKQTYTLPHTHTYMVHCDVNQIKAESLLEGQTLL